MARARELLGLAAPVPDASTKAQQAAEADPAAPPALAQPCPCCGGPHVRHRDLRGRLPTTGRPRPSAPSGSTPHERHHHFPYPHRRTPSSLVIRRPRRASARSVRSGVFLAARIPKKHRQRTQSVPNPSHDQAKLRALHLPPPRPHHQIPIARGAAPPQFPRVPSQEAFGRRPRCKRNRRRGPLSETLHSIRHSGDAALWRASAKSTFDGHHLHPIHRRPAPKCVAQAGSNFPQVPRFHQSLDKRRFIFRL